MGARVNGGPRVQELDRDSEGHRTYSITFRVQVDNPVTEGPASALNATGLPLPGTSWAIVTGDSTETLAWFRPDASARKAPEIRDGHPVEFYDVRMVASTRPVPPDKQRCGDTPIENPLLEPPRISGSFANFTREVSFGYDGTPARTSSHERVRGTQVEFEVSRPTVTIEQNVANLELEVFGPLTDTVNDAPLWGLPARTIRFRPGPWRRNYYGLCLVYYTRTLTFEAWVDEDADGSLVSGWDREVLDEGTKALRGRWGAVSGTGCTINVTSVDSAGGILAATLGAGGSGYPADSTFGLLVDVPPPDGEGGVSVYTNSSGVVVGVHRVYAKGHGYSVDTGLATGGSATGKPLWIVPNADGLPPDHEDPGNFDVFTDLQGSPQTVILDGLGLPIGGYVHGAVAEAGRIPVRYYRPGNFLALGVPLIL